MNDFADAAKKGGLGMNVLGIITIILGFLVMLAPMLTGFSILMLVGVLVLIAGLVRMFWAFTAGSFGKGVLAFAIGGLTLLLGLALMFNPLFASGVMTIVMAIYLIVDGAVEISAAFGLRPESGWGWLLFGGIVSILLGIMIWRQYPLSGAWAIGVLLGIKLLFIGLSMLTVGSTVRTAAKA